MKPNNMLMLTLALSGTFLITACNRDRDAAPAADTTTAEPAAPATEPAPAPSPMPEPAAPAAVVDSGMPFDAMDKNADGGIALDELAATEMLHQHFTQADTDQDGKLSPAEVDKHRADMAAAPGA
jgi:hypothetical protein